MPPTPKKKSQQNSLPGSGLKGRKANNRDTLSELSQNYDEKENRLQAISSMITIDGEEAMRLTRELIDSIAPKDIKEYLSENLEESHHNLEIYGWSRSKFLPNSLYDNLFTPDFNVKQLTLRGRGIWDTCKCPSKGKDKTTNGVTQIDISNPGNLTKIERLNIMRPFRIKACTLLDLIARSPNLKIVCFFGVLIEPEHHESFSSVRFMCELERLYWPWCNRKQHLPTLKLLVKRNDNITTFYSNGDTTCDLLGSDLLKNLRYLSLILNESWACKDKSLKRPNRYLKKIAYLALAKKLEALEIRTFKLDIDEYEMDEEIDSNVRRLYENYQLTFWENVAKLPNLRFLGIYGAWELDMVARELARHGLQIEYLKTNLVPSSMIPAIDAGENLLKLTMCDSIKELRKLSKLRSLHFACHENLANIDTKTVGALKELADLIWVFDLRIKFSSEVEDLVTNILRRGFQQGKSFTIKLHVEFSKKDYASSYFETGLKFTSGLLVRQQLEALVQQHAKERNGKFKQIRLYGIEEASNRDPSVHERLSNAWDHYNKIFQPIDIYA